MLPHHIMLMLPHVQTQYLQTFTISLRHNVYTSLSPTANYLALNNNVGVGLSLPKNHKNYNKKN